MTLNDHRDTLRTINQQRKLLDENLARSIAAAIADGYTINEVLAERDDKTSEFDL